MTDIVERLRNPMWVHSHATFPSPQLEKTQTQADMSEAADEIVRLRATIAQLRSILVQLSSVAGAVSIDAVTFNQIKKDAKESPYAEEIASQDRVANFERDSK